MRVPRLPGQTRQDHNGLRTVYRTKLGRMLLGDCQLWAAKLLKRGYRGEVDLIFTSPPFPLIRKKQYGNHQGKQYEQWLVDVFSALQPLLSPTGSIVVEIGNTWVQGLPAMSLTPIRTLLRVIEETGLDLCEQFVVHNPARLPGPIEWVNRRRIRVKDAFTHIWWLGDASHAKANNRRVLKPYSGAMSQLLASGRFNSGPRPSEWSVGESGFLKNNGGAIPDNVIVASHTRSTDGYFSYCKAKGYKPHPARMQVDVPAFFIKLLTAEGDLVLDPFAGSNTTGSCAEQLGRRWIGTEVSPEYALGSFGRFQEARE